MTDIPVDELIRRQRRDRRREHREHRGPAFWGAFFSIINSPFQQDYFQGSVSL